MTKKIVRCKKCKQRVPNNSIGFVKSNELCCSEFDRLVDKDDGCTFGQEGDPIYKTVSNIRALIEGEAAVYGNHTKGLYTW